MVAPLPPRTVTIDRHELNMLRAENELLRGALREAHRIMAETAGDANQRLMSIGNWHRAHTKIIDVL